MTPARRKRLIRNLLILVALMAILGGAQFLLNGVNIPAMLLQRKPGTLDRGTILVHASPDGQTPGARLSETDLPPEGQSPVKIDFASLGDWKFREGQTPIPDEILKLNGQWIEVSGFMFSNNQTQFTSRFIMVQSLWDCCFGKSPDMNHFIDIQAAPGRIVHWYDDPVRIIGRFSVGELKEQGYLVSIYRLEAHLILVK